MPSIPPWCGRINMQPAKRMARPVGKRLEIYGLISLQKHIRPFGEAPLAKMEIRAS